MLRGKSLIGVLACATVLLAGAALPARAKAVTAAEDGHRHDTVYLSCSSTRATFCYFAILHMRGGMVQARVARGAATSLPDLEIGKDYYWVTLDQPPPASLAVCRAMAFDVAPCRWGVLSKTINDAGASRR